MGRFQEGDPIRVYVEATGLPFTILTVVPLDGESGLIRLDMLRLGRSWQWLKIWASHAATNFFPVQMFSCSKHGPEHRLMCRIKSFTCC